MSFQKVRELRRLPFCGNLVMEVARPVSDELTLLAGEPTTLTVHEIWNGHKVR